MTHTLIARGCSYLILITLCLASGCSRVTEQKVDEENNSYFVLGQSRVRRMDYSGAAQAFNKALEENPRSASAHFELALVEYQHLSNYASAIHHFEKFLAFRPKAPHADTVRGFIMDCKQELAKGVSLAAVSQKMQKEMENITRENQQLREQVDFLAQALAIATNVAPQVQLVYTNSASPALSDFPKPAFAIPASPKPRSSSTQRSQPPASSAIDSSAFTPLSAPKTHVVRSGETPFSIARKHGVKLTALMAANPRLDPKKLKAGQTLQIPAK